MRTLLCLLAGLVALSPFRTALAQIPAPESGPFYRYLILVDSSAAMKRRRESTAKSIADLVHSGFGGRAQQGDTIGLWTFGEEVDAAAFSAMKWSEPLRTALTARATRFVMERKYSGKSNLDRAVQAILMATRTSKDVTVFIFSDGNDVLYGTPYDLDISTVYILHRDDLKTSKCPFITSLAARGGRIKAWAVDSGGGTVTIPQIKEDDPPAAPKTPDDKTVASKEPSKPTETKDTVQKPAPRKTTRPQPRVVQSIELPTRASQQTAASPKEITPKATEISKGTPPAKEPPARVETSAPAELSRRTEPPRSIAATTPKQSWPPKTVTPRKAPGTERAPTPPASPTVNPETQPATSAKSAPSAQPAKPPIKTQPAARPTPIPEPAPVEPVPAKPAPEPKPAPTTVTDPAPVATNPKTPTAPPPPERTVTAKPKPSQSSPPEASSQPAPKPPPAPAALAAPLDDPGSSSRFIFMALALLLAAGIIAYLALRKSRAPSHASIISQSLDRERE